MKVRKTLIYLLIFLPMLALAQQPFEQYGYRVKVATLSGGKYVEFFDQDSLVEIGSIVLNTNTGKIVAFLKCDTVYSEATMEPEVISRWLSPDPLSDKFYSYSPYHFSGNNPIRFVDPDGRAFIDYYDQSGDRIGTDGNNDGRVVVVTDRREARQIRETNDNGGTTAMNQVRSGVELPSAGVRTEMGNAVDRSNTANGDDTRGGFHEEGGIYGTTENGGQTTNPANAGPAANPKTDPHAEIDVWSGEQGNISTVQGTYHVHPSGSIQDRPGANTLGPTTTYAFDQPPSPQDFGNARQNANPNSDFHTTGNNYVIGAGSGTVYIYNQGGQVATFPLRQFRAIGNQ